LKLLDYSPSGICVGSEGGSGVGGVTGVSGVSGVIGASGVSGVSDVVSPLCIPLQRAVGTCVVLKHSVTIVHPSPGKSPVLEHTALFVMVAGALKSLIG